ncbi:MAG: hypothetical protein DWQ49_12490 [Bacteroidetes bacterium]|nr:MAG: hypothetical protein DWQ49_12490 [Bacteroidota bacterium]
MAEEFLSKSRFSKMIEEAVLEKKMSYMDAILDICEKNKIEPEDVRKFVSPIIKDKLEAEAMSLNLLPKTNALDESFFE